MENDEPAVAPPPLNDILSYGMDNKLSVEDRAAAVQKWRDHMVQYGEKTVATDNPQKFFAGTTAMERDAGTALQTLMGEKVRTLGSTYFSDSPGTWDQFLYSYQRNPAAAQTINADAKKDMDQIVGNPAFRMPTNNQFTPIPAADGSDLGVFQVQRGSGKDLNVLVNLHNQDKTQQDSGVLKVPAVTDDDVSQRVAKAQKDLEYASKEADTWAASEDPNSLQLQKGFEQQAAQAQAQITTLSGPQGKNILQHERVMDAFKDSPLAAKAGQWGLGEDVWRGFSRLVGNVDYAIAHTVGSDDQENERRQYLQYLDTELPGTTRPTTAAQIGRSTAEMAGQMPALVNPASAGVLAVSSAGDAIKQSMDAADAAEAQAGEFKDSHPELAQQFKDMATQMRNDANEHGALTGATYALMGRLIPKGNTVLGRALGTGAEFGGINAVTGQLLKPKFTGKADDPMTILEGALLGAGTGAIHGGVEKLREPAPAPPAAPTGSTPPGAAPGPAAANPASARQAPPNAGTSGNNSANAPDPNATPPPGPTPGAQAGQPGGQPGSSQGSQGQPGSGQPGGQPGGAGPAAGSQSAPGPQAAPKGPPARQFNTQSEFNAFMENAAKSGDVEQAAQAFAMNNDVWRKAWIKSKKKWAANQTAADEPFNQFMDSMFGGRNNAEHADYVQAQANARSTGPGTPPGSNPGRGQGTGGNDAQARPDTRTASQRTVDDVFGGEPPAAREMPPETPAGEPSAPVPQEPAPAETPPATPVAAEPQPTPAETPPAASGRTAPAAERPPFPAVERRFQQSADSAPSGPAASELAAPAPESARPISSIDSRAQITRDHVPWGKTAVMNPDLAFKQGPDEYAKQQAIFTSLSQAYGVSKALEMTNGEIPFPSVENFNKQFDNAYWSDGAKLRSKVAGDLRKFGVNTAETDLPSPDDFKSGLEYYHAMSDADQKMRKSGASALASELPFRPKKRPSSTAPTPDETVKRIAVRAGDDIHTSRRPTEGYKEIERSNGVKDAERGFVTSTGRFVTPEEAAKISGIKATSDNGGLTHMDLLDARPRTIGRQSEESVIFQNSHPIATMMSSIGGLMSKTQAQKRGSDFWDKNKSLWDDAPRLAHPTHNAIYSKTGGMMPDQMAQALHEQGIGDGTESTLWNIIDKESQGAVKQAEGQRNERSQMASDEKLNLQQGAAFKAHTSEPGAGKRPVDSWDLRNGDTVYVDGEPMKVHHMEDGDAVLEDGAKFGKQILQTGEEIYVEKVEHKPEEDDEPAPTLRPGTEQGDMLEGTRHDPFSLFSETASERAVREATADAARKKLEAQEADRQKAVADQQQGKLFPQEAPPQIPPRSVVNSDFLNKVRGSQGGFIDLDAILRGVGVNPQALTRGIQGALGTWAGETFPKTTARERTLGEKGARWISSRIAAPFVADVFSQQVAGADPDFDFRKFGAALSEDNLRSVKDNYLKAGEPAKAAKVATLIGKPNSPFPTEAEYQAYLADPATQQAVDRHKTLWQSGVEPMYRSAMMLDASHKLEPRGLQTGARVNLYATDPNNPGKKPVVTVGSGNLQGTMRRKSVFGRQAKGTGSYNVDYREMMENTFGSQLETANKNNFEQALVKTGNAVIDDPGEEPKLADGEDTVPFPLVRRQLIQTANGNKDVIPISKNIYVRASLAGEYQRASNVERWPAPAVLLKVAGLLNKSALAGLTDATVHLSNLATILMTRPIGNPIVNGLAAIMGRADIPVVFTKVLIKAFQKNPAVKAQLARLAEIGALRQDFPSRNPGHKLIQAMDQAVRLIMDDSFDQMVKLGLVEDTETARREFVNQVGQYNKRAQGDFMTLFRNTVAPFATAGRNFNVLGIRTLLQNPGVSGKTIGATAALKANMLSKWLGFFIMTGMLNYLLTKNKGGGVLGRPGVKIGHIDTGTSDANGRPLTINALDLVGLGRGLRVTGIRGLLESYRNDLPGGVMVDSALRDIYNANISPFAGPIIHFGFGLANSSPAVNVGTPFPIVPPGDSQLAGNFYNALKEANPLVASFFDMKKPGATKFDWLRRQLPRFMMNPSNPPDMMANYPEIVHKAQLNAYVEDVIHRARKMEPETRQKYLDDVLTGLPDADKIHANKEFRYRKVR